MSGQRPLTFGVEVEMILSPKNHEDGMVRYDLAMIIANYHNNGFNDDSDLKMLAIPEDPQLILRQRGYGEWGLLNDGTVMPGKSKSFPMELTSPILEFSKEGDWRNHIRKAFHSVEAVAGIKSNISCGTHVHIAPGRGAHWTTDELREIAHAIVFFEGAFLELVPKSRKRSLQCKSNVLPFGDPNPKAEDCWETIKHSDIQGLIRLLCPNDRYYAWNFYNLLREDDDDYDPAHCNGFTLEWRMPPGVTTAEECLMWTELALYFVQAARQPGSHAKLMERRTRAVEGLKEFIKGSMRNPDRDMRYLNPVFKGKSGRTNPSEPRSDKPPTDKDEKDKKQRDILNKLRKKDNKWDST